MRSLAGAFGWLERLWKGSGARPASGTAEVRPVVEALADLEALACDAVAHRPLEAIEARRAARARTPGAPQNAFGRPVVEIEGGSAAGAVAAATGLALTGLRATAFLRGPELIEALPALHSAARRQVPLVLHAVNALQGAGAGHDSYHAVADAGWFQVLAHSGQHAIDLTLLARWLTERALVPGLVAVDGFGLEDLRVPSDETLRGWLGWPRDRVPAPDDAQRLLFGRERARALAWLDADHPLALGGPRDPRDEAIAALGRQQFFAAAVQEMAAQGMRELSTRTGRPLSFVDTWGVDDADRLIVAQGSLVPVARAVAEALRRSRLRIGVVGVTWLRPFPAEALRRVLSGSQPVAVLELLAEPGADLPPLWREVAAAIGDRPLVSAMATEVPDPARVAALCEVLGNRDVPLRIRLDAAQPRTRSLPRRDALDQALAVVRPPDDPLPATPPVPQPAGQVALGVAALGSDLDPEAPTRLARALRKAAGEAVRGLRTDPVPGVHVLRLEAGPTAFPDPGLAAPVSLLAVLSEPERLGPWPLQVSRGGALLLLGVATAEDAAASLPIAWRHRVRLDGLHVLFAPREEWVERLATWSSTTPEATEVPEALLDDTDPGGRLPAIVRRIPAERRTVDSLPRLWGEQVQPRRLGVLPPPDPASAVGAVPALATALAEPHGEGPLPALDAAKCTGCGACWAACPDSALAAVVLTPEGLLGAAGRRADVSGPEADALRRAHKHLGSRVASQLAKGEPGAVGEAPWRDAFAWVVDRLGVAEDDRPLWQAALDATLDQVQALDLVATHRFLHAREARSKGTGELLAWAVDPRTCQSCGLCATACAEEAIALAPRAAQARARWSAAEELPDTTGATIAEAWEDPEVGPLAAVLLSRHCAQALLGGGRTEPGSGERLAVRAVAALAEYHGQRGQVALLETTDARRKAVAEWLTAELGAKLAGAGPDVLADALEQGGGEIDLGDLAERLEARGQRAVLDRPALQRAAHLVDRLLELRQCLVRGVDGLGRARFAVVAVSGPTIDALLRFPEHPFFAPVVVDGSREAVDLARGVARGLVAEHLEHVRLLRSAALVTEGRADLADRLADLDTLSFADLDPAEQAACPPLLLLAGDRVLRDGLGWLGPLLREPLPIKVVLLDGLDVDRRADPALVALAHRDLFCLSSSPAFGDHLATGLADALAFPGPALVLVHAPSPGRDGFAPDATLEQARAAVSCRAHPLLRYDPGAEGTFGTRIRLDGNPDPDAPADLDALIAFAAGQVRFASRVGAVESGTGRQLDPAIRRWAEGRVATWSTLRELAGDAGPFADRLRESLRAEVDESHRAEIDALRAEYEALLEAARTSRDREAVEHLTRSLMAIAGRVPNGEEA